MRLVKLALLSLSLLCFAQQKPAFEVATVKPNPGPDAGFSFDIATGGRVTASNFSLWNLIRSAYRTRDLQMSGGPPWIKTRGFDIQAQPPHSATPVTREQTYQMLQALIEDRFQMKWHRESREGPAYRLIVAPGGPKVPPPHEGRARTMFGDLDAPSMTLDGLCQILEFDLGRPVLNRTGLTGPFTIRLQWASDRNPAPANPSDESRPSLFTAIQEQLGLKIESIKAPIEFFVIDSAEIPSEN